MHHLHRMPWLGAILLLATACSDESFPPPSEALPLVRVTDAASGEAVAGVKVVLMTDWSNTPLAPAAVSADDGSCDFGDLGSHQGLALAFGGGQWRVFGRIGPSRSNESTLPAPKTAPASPTLQVVVSAIPPPHGAHISGTVTDAATGDPLDQVFVATTPYRVGYLDPTGPGDDVTLADGAFRVSEIPFLAEPGTGRPIQVLPLFVTRHGYLPRVWLYQARPGEIIDEITGVVIALEPDTATARGGLRGRLLRQGEPVPWVLVGLGTATDFTTKGGPGLTGWTALTDAEGVFVFADLPADRYVLHPAYLPGDGAFYPDQEANFPRDIPASAELDAGDFELLWEMEARSPFSGERVPADHRSFSWDAVPGAAIYGFLLDRAAEVRVAEPRYELPAQELLSPGNHVWSVFAYDADGATIGTFGSRAEFHVPAGDGAR